MRKKDPPAFLGNHIGFPFINEALRYAEKYKDNGIIDYIDAILGSFTARTMAPLATSDKVIIDVLIVKAKPSKYDCRLYFKSGS